MYNHVIAITAKESLIALYSIRLEVQKFGILLRILMYRHYQI